MRSVVVTTTTGDVESGETNTKMIPSWFRPGVPYPIVIGLHGAGVPQQYSDLSRWGSFQLAHLLAMKGIPFFSAQMHGDVFGTVGMMAAINDTIAWAGTVTGLPTTKVHIIGISKGAYDGMQYARQNPTKVASYTGIIPLCDIVTMYNTNAGGLQAEIGSSWGVTYPTPLPSAADITSTAAAMNGAVPSQLLYSGVDAFIPPSTVTAMSSVIGASRLSNIDSSYGHAEGTINEAVSLGGAGTAADIANFIMSHGG